MECFIAVIGGDARYLELIRQIQIQPHTSITLVGFDKIEQSFTGLKQTDFHELEVEKLDIVILPITGTGSAGEVETVFSDQKITIAKDRIKKLKDTALVFTGITNNYLSDATK